MDNWLSAEQKLLKESAERFIAKEYGFEARQARAAEAEGFSRATWASFAEMGWLAAPLPEEHDGLGGGTLEVAVVMEALGRGLAVEPFVPTVVLGAGLVARGGSDAQKAELLPAVAAGELLLAFGHSEPRSRYDLARVETTATADGQGFRLDGHKSVVFHAGSADKLLVSARSGGGVRDAEGVSLFLLDRDTPGVELRAYATNDGGRAAEVALSGVNLGPDSLIGPRDQALPLIEAVADEACVALAAEAVGGMDVLVTATRDYLQQRQQFGVPLANFQVLQHRAVDMFMACELSRSLTYRAAGVLADPATGAAARAQAASAAKVQVGKAGKLIGQDAVQLHGGMGMTQEMSVGHYFKRLTMIGATFGDADHHLRRFAAA